MTALHVLEPFTTIPESEKRARDVLETVPAVADDRSTMISSEFAYGHGILRYTDLYTTGRIVIDGSHRTDTADDSFGNVPEALVRRTRVPVTILRSAVDDRRIAFPETVLVSTDRLRRVTRYNTRSIRFRTRRCTCSTFGIRSWTISTTWAYAAATTRMSRSGTVQSVRGTNERIGTRTAFWGSRAIAMRISDRRPRPDPLARHPRVRRPDRDRPRSHRQSQP